MDGVQGIQHGLGLGEQHGRDLGNSIDGVQCARYSYREPPGASSSERPITDIPGSLTNSPQSMLNPR